jgi:hypothetical protein
MMYPLHHRAARNIPVLTPLLLTLALLFTAGMAFAAAIGDQVELHATHQAGIPLTRNPVARMTSSASRMARERM